MKREKKNYLQLLCCIVLLILIGSAIGSLTKGGIDTWYKTLNRSPITPPNYLFGIVWSFLYAMIATSGWLIWQSPHSEEVSCTKKLYIAQLILNWSWTPLFFYYQSVFLALICLISIVILVAMLIVQSYKKNRLASLFLIPYWLWLLLATHLNFYIYLNN